MNAGRHLVSKAAFAAAVGRSRSLISRACRHGALRPAMVGDRIDVTHAAAKAWCRQRGLDPRKLRPRPAPKAAAKAPKAAPSDEPPEELQELRRLRAEVEAHLGSVQEYTDLQRARRAAAEADEAERRHETATQRLISRALVRRWVLGYVDAMQLRLLRDVSVTLAVRLGGAARTGATREDLARLARDIIGGELRAAQRALTRGLRAVASGREPPEEGERPEASGGVHVASIVSRLCEDTAGDLAAAAVDATAKAIGRTASGRPWRAEVFGEALELAEDAREEAERQVRTMITARLQGAARDLLHDERTAAHEEPGPG